MKLRNLVLLLTCLGAAACSDPAERGRYQAERARYWAEREDIRFALESNPQLRAGYLASGIRHAAVADQADPRQWPDSDPAVLEDLRDLEGRERIQAGVAFLRAGRMGDADPQLRHAMERSPERYAREASWLLGKGYEQLEDFDRAEAAYRDLFTRVLAGSPDAAPTEQLLAIPVEFAALLARAQRPEQLAGWVGWARETYDAIARRWPDDGAAHRSRFLVYRLAVAQEDWGRAVSDLERFEASAPTLLDQARAQANRAQILAGPLNEVEQARELYQSLGQLEEVPRIASLAQLRLAEMELSRGDDPARAVQALEEVAARFADLTDIAAEAEIHLAELLVAESRWAEALQAYRHVQTQYPDAVATLSVPAAIVAIHVAQGHEDRAQVARRDARSAYRRVLAAHPGDSQLGVLARQNLVGVLLEIGEPEEALQELDQLYHLRGRSVDGMRALLAAASIARDELGSTPLARRYLLRIVEEMPASPSATEAERILAELDAP